MTIEKIADRTLGEWQEFARRDDCLDRMVPSDLRTILAALRREREPVVPQPDALALVAAAYRDAAETAGDRCAACGCREIAGLVKEHVMRRTPADAQAALTAIERAAYERGVRDAAEKCDAVRNHEDTTEDESVGALCCALEILALLTQEGR